MTAFRFAFFCAIALGLGIFVFRAIGPAYADTKNDFSDPYCASLLWRKGQNPYDSSLATKTNQAMAHVSIRIVPVYPPTAYVLISPFTFLHWRAANLLWSILGLVGVGSLAYTIPGIAGLTFAGNRAWFVAACVFCAVPLQTSLHVANSSAIAIAVCVLGVYLAGSRKELFSGLLLAIGMCLKPQLGIWFFIFYVIRRRWRMVLPATIFAGAVTLIAFSIMPVTPSTFLHDYRSNLHYWFDPGRMNDFSAANPFSFQLVNTQVLVGQVFHDNAAATLVAWTLFAVSAMTWGWRMLRCSVEDDLLALSSVLALGMIPLYHRSYDAAIVLLSLAWSVSSNARGMLARLAPLVLYLVLEIPVSWSMDEVRSHLSIPLNSHVLSTLAMCQSFAVLTLNFVLLYCFVRRRDKHCQLLSPVVSVTEHEQSLLIAV